MNDDVDFFVKLMIRVRDEDILRLVHGSGGATYAVWIALGLHVGQRGTCFPGYARLSELTGYNRSTVIRAVRRLETLGLITVQHRFTRQGNDSEHSKDYSSNLYDLHGWWWFGYDKNSTDKG